MGNSHQTQGGKCSVNLPLSRSCEERRNSLSQNARRVVNPLRIHLRGTDDANIKLLRFDFCRKFKGCSVLC